MRIPIILALAVLTVGCSSRGTADRQLDNAYRFYAEGDCNQAALALSRAERGLRLGSPVQAEISLLRGQCLERQALFLDAAQTYQFILSRYPASEYAYRARARLDTLRQLGHGAGGEPVVVTPVKP